MVCYNVSPTIQHNTVAVLFVLRPKRTRQPLSGELREL